MFQNEIRSLGEGGFGTTTLVELPDSKRAVLKRLKKSAIEAYGNVAVELFKKESQYLEVLGNHSQIPALIDQGIDEDGPWILQEYIPGENLEQILSKQSFFTDQEIQALLKSVLDILNDIHSKNAIHRDVKPANIIYHDGQYYLVDFGASKRVSETVLRKTGTTIGSASYAAPEQVIGHAVFASDIYSLGVTAIHLLTAMEPMDLIDRMNAGKWVWRDYLASPVSEGLGLILDKMLEYGVHRRYGNAQQVIDALEKIDRRAIARSRVANIGRIRKTKLVVEWIWSVAKIAVVGYVAWGVCGVIPTFVNNIGSFFTEDLPAVSNPDPANSLSDHFDQVFTLMQIALAAITLLTFIYACVSGSNFKHLFFVCFTIFMMNLLFFLIKPELIVFLENIQAEAVALP